jgi:UDP-glucose 4-epimerase
MVKEHKMKSLVTGGAGFIGSHVARYCLNMGHDVTILDDLSGGFEDNVPEGANFIKGSIIDHELLASLFTEKKFDFVYHLAAYAAEGLSHFIRRFNYSNNVVGSVNLINEAIKHEIRRFVFTSSIAVYGSGQVPMSEEMEPLPEDPYGIAKYTVELDLRAAHDLFGLNYIIFRPHNVYGEHQNVGDRYRNVVGIFINQLSQGKPMTIFGDGHQSRAFSHIDDVAPIISRSVLVQDANNEVFNIGADTPITINDLSRMVADALGQQANVEYLPARNEVMHSFANHAKAKKVLGSVPSVSLEEGIRRMAEWAMRVGIRESQGFQHIELRRSLPPSWAELEK